MWHCKLRVARANSSEIAKIKPKDTKVVISFLKKLLYTIKKTVCELGALKPHLE